ncbi:MAG: hypothetical protein J7L15_04940, partial [Clostridiales bacterium]|nr:hypothetical protein [Clostridiales bacterium]
MSSDEKRDLVSNLYMNIEKFQSQLYIDARVIKSYSGGNVVERSFTVPVASVDVYSSSGNYVEKSPEIVSGEETFTTKTDIIIGSMEIDSGTFYNVNGDSLDKYDDLT